MNYSERQCAANIERHIYFIFHAAQRNHPQALMDLSYIAEKGVGRTRLFYSEERYEVARNLIDRAAALGHVEAKAYQVKRFNIGEIQNQKELLKTLHLIDECLRSQNQAAYRMAYNTLFNIIKLYNRQGITNYLLSKIDSEKRQALAQTIQYISARYNIF